MSEIEHDGAESANPDQRRAAAAAYFQKKCKERSGERIYRTVRNVEGIRLVRPRQRPTEQDLRNQDWRGDPYGHDADGDHELVAYLADLDANSIPVLGKTSRPGYRYVEFKASDGGVVRTSRDARTGRITKTRVSKFASAYQVDWKDISTEEDRRHWVAGGKLTISARKSGAILAERVGYLHEAGLGSADGGRRPWLYARLHYSHSACPPWKRHEYINRGFVERVLQPAWRE